ncbi:kelch domain-containing protein 10 homolog [Teleopsis dalmanni]|uniref:kelch domain-containing protein 10 homolog n=1 Tax=Teleopsis dalmanni TaxID=139649 RepID=UPI0018CCBA98|nr:kelch domain-containing protein 10 homolog [Teleopsis dalmanni]
MKIFSLSKFFLNICIDFFISFCEISENYIYRTQQSLRTFRRILKTIMDEDNELVQGLVRQRVIDDIDPDQPIIVEDVNMDDEIYSSAEEVDWTSSNSSDSDDSMRGAMLPLRSLQGLAQYNTSRPKKMYTFQPYRLTKRYFRNRNAMGGYPLARSGHRVIASESNLYSLGGYNPRTANSARRRGRCLLFQELWAYNFAANKWSLVLDARTTSGMPTELASNALTIYKNVLISHGGTGFPFGEYCSNDCYFYSTGQKSIVTKLQVTGDLPLAQYGPAIVIHNDYLYTIGGTTGFDYSCDIYRLHLIKRVWENVYISRPEMRDDPEGRYRHEVVYDGKHIYVLGGGTSQLVYDLERIPAFNLKTNRWEYYDTLPDPTLVNNTDPRSGYPKPRKCFACVQHTLSNGDVEAFISGGLQGDSRTYFADIWKINITTKQWYLIRTARLPRPIYFHSAANSGNGCMYIFGGIECGEKDMRRRNDLYKMWMTIPKLSEMCWDAITYYNEDLDVYNREILLDAGIPDRFVNRVPLRIRKKPRSEINETRLDSSFENLPKRQRSRTQ